MKDFSPTQFLLLGFWLEAETTMKLTKNIIFERLEADNLLSVAVANAANREDLELGVARRRLVCTVIGSFEASCAEMGLVASVATIKKLQRLNSEPDPGDEKIVELVHELKGRLQDEMQEASFFSLTPQEALLYRQPLVGWEKIITRFPAVVSDIEEAAKSYALSRYAASVFHCLQVIEHGLIELGKFIGVVDPRSGWTAVCNQLKKVLKSDYAARTPFERDSFAFIEQVYGTTEALKNAWRNKVSHAQGKLALLTSDLTPQIAEEIMYATRAFMHRLVDGLP
ncbi:MAG TPA: hypothetical protein VGQ21_02445 [Thermoanaerobaculia bacterium]|jgi:hypothetical protein|nr:hypothetical protein [Thermoanaerobaculia bacterium]